jgi:pullulanase
MFYGQFSAILLNLSTIRIVLNNEKHREDDPRIMILKNNEQIMKFKLINAAFQFRTNIYDLELEKEIELGNDYTVFIENYGRNPLNLNNLPYFDEFDDLFAYDGPLGPQYKESETSFYLWAPLASKVWLKHKKPRAKEWTYTPMDRSKKGVYKTTLKGDQDGLLYRFMVTNSGVVEEVTDPYGLSSTANASESAVINLAKCKVPLNNHKLPPLKRMSDMIIYETSVRDMTSDPLTNVKNRGTFLGLIEKGRKSKRGGPVGFDYLVDLGVTHIQLLPIYDFKTVNELDKWKTYNWGYDPQQYFVPEGSYSTKPNDPYSRIIELKQMVSAFHNVGIRISMDVVYNHVYDYDTSVFERIVPNYYFRRSDDGRICMGSGCGNDLATERPMVRRLIIDSALHFVKTYGIDAFRMDLMGLIDIDTVKELYKKAREINPSFMIYGEGWNMLTGLDMEDLANMNNAFQLPEIGFFNDSFREIIKGGSFADKIHVKGYILGAKNYRHGFKFAYLGSTQNETFEPIFIHAGQSINYVECHDNGTLIDKIIVSNSNEDLNTMLRRLQMANAVTMLSFGVPFFHRGQEIGLSKYGDMNSYRSSDKVNQFAYALANKRESFVDYFKDLTKLRRECEFLREEDPAIIKKMVKFIDLDHGGIAISYKNIEERSPYRLFNVFINISSNPLFIALEEPQKTIFNQNGYIEGKANDITRNLMVPPHSVIIMGLRKEDEQRSI